MAEQTFYALTGIVDGLQEGENPVVKVSFGGSNYEEKIISVPHPHGETSDIIKAALVEGQANYTSKDHHVRAIAFGIKEITPELEGSNAKIRVYAQLGDKNKDDGIIASVRIVVMFFKRVTLHVVEEGDILKFKDTPNPCDGDGDVKK